MIDFNKGNAESRNIRLVDSDDIREDVFELNENWSHYSDLDFCVECFKEESLCKYLKGV